MAELHCFYAYGHLFFKLSIIMKAVNWLRQRQRTFKHHHKITTIEVTTIQWWNKTSY